MEELDVENLIYKLVDEQSSVDFSENTQMYYFKLSEMVKDEKLLEYYKNAMWEDYLMKRDEDLKKVFIYAFKLATEIFYTQQND